MNERTNEDTRTAYQKFGNEDVTNLLWGIGLLSTAVVLPDIMSKVFIYDQTDDLSNYYVLGRGALAVFAAYSLSSFVLQSDGLGPMERPNGRPHDPPRRPRVPDQQNAA